MKRFTMKVLSLALLLLLMAATASAKSVEQERQEINDLSAKILARLYEKYPHANRVIEKCYGYATLGAVGNQWGLWGDSHGRGVAINNETGEKVYMKIQEFKLGFGVSLREFDLVFIFGTPESWQSFVSGKFKFGAAVDAAATDSVNGESLNGATMVGENMWVYQTTTKGIALEATLKGMNIYPNKKLNAKN